jgi:hypothetical protein
MAPQWKVADQSPKKIRIKGKALFAFEKFFKKGVSGNQRKYILDELQRSARTLQNVPIDVNHEISLWEEATGHNWSTYKGKKPKAKGHVMWGEEEGGELEYVAEVNDPVYRQKVVDTWSVKNDKMTVDEYKAKWRKPPLEGVSVDADFLHLRCSKCNDDKRYFDLNEYKNHMWEAHFIKTFEIEPRGIKYKRLSLVEPPEKPGVQGAGFELVETQQGMLKLYEALLLDAEAYHSPIVDEGNPYQSYNPEKGLTQKSENTNMENKEKIADIPRYALSPDTRVMFDPRADYDFTAKEQAEDDGPPAEVKECPAGQHWDPERQECVPDAEDDPAATVTEQEDHECEEGYHWDEEENKCVPDEAPSATEQQECEEGYQCSEEKGKCVPNETPAVEEQEHVCPEDFHWDPVLQNCVADEPPTTVVAPPVPSIGEFTRLIERVTVLEKLAKQKDPLAEKQLKEKQLLEKKQEKERVAAQFKQLKETFKRELKEALEEAERKTDFKVAHAILTAKKLTEASTVQTDAKLREQKIGVMNTLKPIIEGIGTLYDEQQQLQSDQEVSIRRMGQMDTRFVAMESSINTTNKTTSALTKKVTEFTTVKPPTLTETLSSDNAKIEQLEALTETQQQEIENLKTHLKPLFKGNSPPPKNAVDYENPDNPHTNY